MNRAMAWGIMLVSLALFLATAAADVRMIAPREHTLQAGGLAEAGALSPGDSFTLIFSTENGTQVAYWKEVEVSSSPQGWTVSRVAQNNPQTFVFEVDVPDGAKEGSEVISFSFASETRIRESARVLVNVSESLVDATADAVRKEAAVGESTFFDLRVVNESLAARELSVDAELPTTWFSVQRVHADNESESHVFFPITPRTVGEKRFDLTLRDADTGDVVERVGVTLDVRPSLRGKYKASETGFPFFSPGMLAYYFAHFFIVR